MNYIKTGFLLVVLSLLLIWAGGLLGGAKGAMIAFLVAMAINGISYWYSDKIVLAIYRAKELPKEEYSHIYKMVKDLSGNAKIPCPRIYYIAELNAPNAFATGRDPAHGALCLTNGLLSSLDKEEIEGVISHELAHIKHRDTLIMTVTAAIASAIMMIANMARWAAISGGSSKNRNNSGSAIPLIVMSILAPIAALLVQLAISRSREYDADLSGAKLTGNPNGLARALLDLERYSKECKDAKVAPQTAHLFIVQPLTGNFFTNLFSTHPPIGERVKRLKGMMIA